MVLVPYFGLRATGRWPHRGHELLGEAALLQPRCLYWGGAGRAGGAGGAREMQVSIGNIWNQPGKLPEACRKNGRVLVEFLFILFSSYFHPIFILFSSYFHPIFILVPRLFQDIMGIPHRRSGRDICSRAGTGEFGQVWINSSVVEEAKANGAVSSPGAEKSTEELQTCWNYAETMLVVHGMIMYVHVGYM